MGARHTVGIALATREPVTLEIWYGAALLELNTGGEWRLLCRDLLGMGAVAPWTFVCTGHIEARPGWWYTRRLFL